jgi:hypothetical protein
MSFSPPPATRQEPVGAAPKRPPLWPWSWLGWAGTACVVVLAVLILDMPGVFAHLFRVRERNRLASCPRQLLELVLACHTRAINHIIPVREVNHVSPCRANLRQLALACHLYADDNNERFPVVLEQLFPAYLQDRKVLVCNCAHNKELPSYAMVRGLRLEESGETIFIYEASLENHRGAGRHVAFADAHVEWWPAAREAEFQARLASQRAARKSRKPPAEPGAAEP